MTIAELEHFRNLLREKEESVSGWLQAPGAVSEADQQKARNLLRQIRESLQRIDKGEEFGMCHQCGGEVEPFRLEVQPVAQVCLDCISASERERLQEDLYLASKIHRALLPSAIAEIPGFTIGVRSAAARFVGGDYYDVLPGAGESTRVIVADCMGMGVSAGLLMANVQGALRVLAGDIAETSALVTRLNRWLCRNVPVTKFVSLVCIALDAASTEQVTLRYTNAGHCPPLILRADGALETLPPTGAVLGVSEDFEFTERTTKINAGDTLVLYTDGVLEAEADGGEMFGEQRLCEYLARHREMEPQRLVDGLIETVRAHCERADLDDDYTVIALQNG